MILSTITPSKTTIGHNTAIHTVRGGLPHHSQLSPSLLVCGVASLALFRRSRPPQLAASLSSSLSMSNGIKRSVSQLSSSLTPPPPEPLLTSSTSASPVASMPFQRKRAKRELKEKMPIVFPSKNTSSQIRIGCHVSAAGGVQNSCENAAKLGSDTPTCLTSLIGAEFPCYDLCRARSFALFLKNQRQWSSAPLPEETVSTLFPESLMGEHILSGLHGDSHSSCFKSMASMPSGTSCRMEGANVHFPLFPRLHTYTDVHHPKATSLTSPTRRRRNATNLMSVSSMISAGASSWGSGCSTSSQSCPCRAFGSN